MMDNMIVLLAILITVLSTSAAESQMSWKSRSGTDNDLPAAPSTGYINPNSTSFNKTEVRQREAEALLDLPAMTDLDELMKRQHKEKIRYLRRCSKSGKWEDWSGLDTTKFGKWDPAAKVKIVTHGYAPPEYHSSTDIIKNTNVLKIGDAYEGSGLNYNVVIVDWTSLSGVTLYRYIEAAVATTYVGENVAEFLRKLKALQLISSWEDVHIVGHSLGAHVAGVAGASIQNSTGGLNKLGRITGLDPAGPLFEQNSTLENHPRALNKNDAHFVDVIHCNMGSMARYSFLHGKYGTTVESGHADFYPDGGESQRGCSVWQNAFETCSHSKCPLYFAQSIISNKDDYYYLACPCSSWKEFKGGQCRCSRYDGGGMAMGEQCSTSARGRYYRFM